MPQQSLVDRVDAFQRRRRGIGLPIGVIYKYVDDGGPHLAALITYYGFISLFPLLLLGSTVLGLLLVDNPELQARILGSAVSQIPGLGDDLQQPERIGGGVAGIVLGGLGALYGALGVGQAMQNAANTAWTVPRNSRPNPFLARGRSLALAVAIGLDVVATTVVASLVGRADFLGPVTSVLALVATFAVHTGVFCLVFQIATGRPLPWMDLLPGALLAAASWLGLQYVGVAYVNRYVNTSSTTNGVFAVVLGLLAFLYLTSVLIVLSMEVNVVLRRRLWPRALLTPFTDNVDLTAADQRSYVQIAKAQRLKGFETIDVEFDPPPRPDDPGPDDAGPDDAGPDDAGPGRTD